jgi:hypothetical protein
MRTMHAVVLRQPEPVDNTSPYMRGCSPSGRGELVLLLRTAAEDPLLAARFLRRYPPVARQRRLPPQVNADAAVALTDALVQGDLRIDIAARLAWPITRTYELVEQSIGGPVVLEI